MNHKTADNILIGLLKKTDEEQKKFLRAFTKMPINSKLDVMEINKKTFYPLKEKYQDIDMKILSYASLIMAIERYNIIDNDVDSNVMSIRAQSMRKHLKRDKLIEKWALIKDLKNNKKLSFREIEKYLKKYHRLNVGHTTIYDLWNEFESTKVKGK